ncbi:winged helix-turn-helix transcriptional regulator [Hyphomicrobium sp. DY-1]|uniref:winged helix-turn-helix transcriptional regulator n=1 Tax=Hyphomicrobium sp. DY-1 TaxID=3075650 RepID=UPI0039C437C8
MPGADPFKRLKDDAEKRGSRAANIYAEACPSRALLELVADKWTLLVMPALRRGRMRNGELMRLVEGVSQKMLTQTLRALESNGLVRRIDRMEVPPHVEYELTELGLSLADAMRKLDSWVETHIQAVEKAREEFKKQNRPKSRQSKL